MTLATAVIPVSPAHKKDELYQDAIKSVKNQTIPTDYILVFDDEARGAAWARNVGTAQVETPFVIWLDSDDRLKPTFVEETIKMYRKGTFVYTDWILNGLIISTPECLHPFEVGQEHIITTLMPVAAWRSVGGFDETLDTLEDEALYLNLAAYGWCGVRCSEPLVEYRRYLGHSLVNKDVVEPKLQHQRINEKRDLFHQRYWRFEHMAQDCGCISRSDKTQIVGARQPNDVLVETLYTPQKVQGAITGRLYPRAGMGKPLWVHIDDAKSRPDMFRIIAENPITASPDVATVKRLAEEAITRESV